MGCSSSKEWQIVPELGDAPLPRSFSLSLPRSLSLSSRKQTRRPREEMTLSSAYETLIMEIEKKSASRHEKFSPSVEKILLKTEEEIAKDAFNKHTPKCDNPFVTKVKVSKATDPEVTEVIEVSELMQGLEEDTTFSNRPHARKTSKRKAHRRSLSSSYVHSRDHKLQRGLGHTLVEISSNPLALHAPDFDSQKNLVFISAQQFCSRCARCKKELTKSETAFENSNPASDLQYEELEKFGCEFDFIYGGYSGALYPEKRKQFDKSYSVKPFLNSFAADLIPGEFTCSSKSAELQSPKIEVNFDSASELHATLPKLVHGAGSRSPNAYPTEDTEAARSPLFDPVILNTIEKALLDGNATSENCYHVGSDTEVKTSQDRDFHQEILHRHKLSKPEVVSSEGRLPGSKTYPFSSRYPEMIDKEICTESIFEQNSFPTVRKDRASIEDYELRCPSKGHDRLVLYVTSLRTIRKTFEDCNLVRSTLQALNVKIDERDVSIHSAFKQELRDLLDIPFPVPRLFIKGRYIGGVEEFMQLNEDNILVKLLKGLPTETPGKICEGCGGFRFIPCTECNGSCKIVGEDDSKIRCPDCNENGLVYCQMCY